MKKLVLFIAFVYGSIGWGGNRSFAQQIDRYQVVTRNNPHVMEMDSLSSLSVGMVALPSPLTEQDCSPSQRLMPKVCRWER